MELYINKSLKHYLLVTMVMDIMICITLHGCGLMSHVPYVVE